MICKNRMRLKRITSIAILLSLISIPNNYVSVVHADSIENNNVMQWEEKKDISTIKLWKIRFKNEVDINSIYQKGAITVTDEQGNLIDAWVRRGDNEKCVFVEPPKGGYKYGQTYYLNISTVLKFTDKNQVIKNPIQMKFTTNDIGTIDIDENSSISKANNTFGFSLVKKLIGKDKNKNLIVSPLSISTILAMTENGADEETKQEMLNCLGLKNVSDKDINTQYYSLLDHYNNLKYVNLKAANSIWTKNGLELNNDFQSITSKYYKSQVKSEDFSNPDTVNKMNQWIDQNTNGQIKKIINSLDNNATAVLINSLYFKGGWKDEFSKGKTQKEDFILATGEKIKVDNMERDSHVAYLKGNNFAAISLPYNDGIEMEVFLPDKGVDVDKFIQNTNKEDLDKWESKFENKEVIQQIPKFKMEYDTDLNDTLKTLGMKLAFDPNKANFKKFANNTDINPIYIGKVEHKACISVDEKGTEAAAVTVEMAVGSSAPPKDPPKPVEFKVDRPFFFTIRDWKTGVILFMGKVENPSTTVE